MMQLSCRALLRQSMCCRKILIKKTICFHHTAQMHHFLPASERQIHSSSVNRWNSVAHQFQSMVSLPRPNRRVNHSCNCKLQHVLGSGFSTHCSRQSSSFAEVSTVSHLYYRIIESFPQGIQMAFAYGSGVYQQQGHEDMSQNMLDFILVVDRPLEWHSENMKRNRHHYSFLKYCGSRCAAIVQEYGAGVYFNTLVNFEDRLIKYGVISTERLVSDLLDWDTLYISGRLHKPVKLLILPENQDLISALQMNLQSAVHAALLLLPEDFCEEALYTTIAGLSYNGDFRMVVGEDRNKVSNIVRPNMEHFRRLYESILQGEEHVQWHPQQGRLEQNPNHITQYHHLQLLPKTVLLLLQENRTRPGSHPDLEEVLKIYANSSHCDDSVARCISHIVWRSSVGQSAKTILTAGARKSVLYTMKKLKKMIRGKPKRETRL
ncbi:phosphatidate cytidylyltransferase, mitochondrial-like [Babylonia areolata]|uniref:phosphatidate cytidylyltransferase, mitochondrial-like n=1 Tax=Babylonia areolata TaxID=304850 RepID=UPI003FD5FF19